MKNLVTNGFDKMTVEKLLMKATVITSEMAENVSVFANPDPSIGDVKALMDELKAAYLAAENRDRIAIVARDAKKAELITMLRQLGLYVNFVAKGNREIALKSGFDLAKDRQPKPPVTFVPAPRVMAGPNAGSLSISTKRIPGACGFEYRLTTDVHLPLTQWSNNSSKLQKFSRSGLLSATRYYACLGVLDSNNTVVYSEPTSFVTQ